MDYKKVPSLRVSESHKTKKAAIKRAVQLAKGREVRIFD